MSELGKNDEAMVANSPSRSFEAAIAAANKGVDFTKADTNSMDLHMHFIPMIEQMVPALIANPKMSDDDILAEIKGTQKYYYSTAGDNPNLRYDIPDDALLEFIRAYRPPA